MMQDLLCLDLTRIFLYKLVIPLRCCVKKYDWGKKGTDSIVARIVKSQMPGYEVDNDTPFAEVCHSLTLTSNFNFSISVMDGNSSIRTIGGDGHWTES